MAAAESDTNQNVHSEVLGTDDSDKKKAGKFQPFKKLFGKRKKREPAPGCEEAKLKPSHSFGNVCNGTFSSDEEPNGALRSSHYSMGSRAFSHDSIFIPDGRTESEQAIQAMSQENVLGKVKTLQQQLAKNIKFGQPPQMTISVRTMGEANTSMEEDVLLSSPMEIETQQDTVISCSGNKSTDTPGLLRTMTLPGTGYEMEEKIAPVKSSRPKRQFSCSGTIETINLDAVPQAVARLDNSAAKHKLAVKPKKQRMSRKHKRLTKGSQSLTITEFEPEDLETELYGDRYPGYNGHIIADKLIQKRDEQKQLQPAEEKRIEDHWGIFEAERIRQIVEMEEQKEMEEQRCQKLEQMQKEQERRHCDEERRQYLLEGELSLKTEEKICNKEERRLLEAEKRQELEEQRRQELEKQRQKELEERQKQEEQSHQEQEEQQRRELEEQKRQEQEEQQRRELEEQKLQQQEEQQRQEHEKQQRQDLEKQKLQEWEEQQRRDLVEQKLQEQEKLQRQDLEEQKLQEQEEQQRRELEEQKLQDREKQQRGELEEQKLQEWEEQQRQDLEEQKLQALEEQQRQELEEEKCQEWEEQQRQDLEEQKLQEWEEKQGQDLEEQNHQWEVQRCQELEEQKHQEEQRHQELEEKRRQELEQQRRLELEELRQHKTENQCQEEEERNWLKEEKEFKEQNKEEKQRRELEDKELQEEKQRRELEEKELQEAEIKLKQEKEAESPKQQKQEEQRQQLKEKGEKTEKEQPQEDKKKKWEEHRKHKLTKQMHMESSEDMQEDELKQQKDQNEQKWNMPEEQEIDPERQNPQQEKSLEQQQDKDQLCSVGVDRHLVKEKLQERSRSQKLKQTEKGNKTAEEILAQKLKREVEAQEQKRIGEELRWQEVDERQTASRPFTFQVSSGDKQIIFQKVNLSPVMPVKGAGVASPSIKDSRMHTASKGSHTLPSSVCVPHTAILVTGAQLCGTAVNLNQIKDTACKSLLGLTEERKNVDIPSPEKAQKKTQDPKPSSSKMKYAQESLNNQAVLAEWASIRSRILKNAENSKYNEKDRVSVCRHSDDWTPRGRGGPHGNLRKTLSANAKFSITPAWQKFSDTSKNNSDAENVSVAKGNETVAVGRTTGLSADSKEDVAPTFKDNLAEKAKEKMETHSETTDNTEGCKFAKDLPSFLVPSFPHSPGKELPRAELPGALENQQSNSTKKADKPAPNGEENVSPFGIKLRRTNYSLRFHYDQQAEQRKKKRYSAGDSFDGVPDPLVTTEGEKESDVFAPQESTSPGTGRVNIPGNLKDSKDSSVTAVEISQPAVTPVVLPATGQSALVPQEKPVCKSLVPQKPALAPKPTSRTPPSSPLSKINRSSLSDTLAQRLVKTESDGWRKEDRVNAAHPTPSSEYKNEEEEIREKKSFFPSISIPWREKNDKKPEPLKKEKPVLQSRHSLDGSKLMEKVETSQPLWITLALQKQKGFREQQATREERRQAREAKQAEKLAKENAAGSNQTDNKSSSSKTSTLQKSTTQEGEKKIETTASRLERREQLKKSNTLPTSVTVEISDSVPSTPLAKEVAKRFSTPDANPVSTEPAWLALAKRKAKAWSDCPQIIK